MAIQAPLGLEIGAGQNLPCARYAAVVGVRIGFEQIGLAGSMRIMTIRALHFGSAGRLGCILDVMPVVKIQVTGTSDSSRHPPDSRGKDGLNVALSRTISIVAGEAEAFFLFGVFRWC